MKKKPKQSGVQSWRHIPIPPFRCGICIFIGSPAACVRHLCKMGFPDAIGVADLKARIAESSAVTICLPYGESCVYSNRDIGHGVLVHELCHAVGHMLSYKEIAETPPNNEVFAYTLEYLFEEATK